MIESYRFELSDNISIESIFCVVLVDFENLMVGFHINCTVFVAPFPHNNIGQVFWEFRESDREFPIIVERAKCAAWFECSGTSPMWFFHVGFQKVSKVYGKKPSDIPDLKQRIEAAFGETTVEMRQKTMLEYERIEEVVVNEGRYVEVQNGR